MKKIKKITLISLPIVAIIAIFIAKHSTSIHKRVPASESFQGEFSILGVNSLYGHYIGHAQINNGKVIRKIHFTDYKYHGNELESIWTGKIENNHFQFSLMLSNLLTRFEDYSPPKEAFQAPTEISLDNSILNNQLSFSLLGEGTYSEKWKNTESISEESLWKDLRQTEIGVGEPSPLFSSVIKFLGITKVVEMYRELPQLKEYKERKEFREAKQYYIQDRTDADFYLNNPTVLRLANKIINPLSLAEAEMKRNAYGKTFLEKANFLHKQTVKNNLNSAGLLEIAFVDEDGKKTGSSGELDSALWSSMFAQAELLRYQITHDDWALQNFKKILNAELTLVEITGDPKQFARTLMESAPDEKAGEEWQQGTGKFAHLKWAPGGNNDMIKGVFTTLILAHQVINELDSETIKRIKNISKNLYLLSPAKSGFNKGIAYGIDALWNLNPKSYDIFTQKMLNILTYIGDVTHIGIGFYFGGITDWSGVNLTMTSTMCQLLLSKELMKVFPDSSMVFKAQQSKKLAEERLMKMVQIYKKAHRDFLKIMAYSNVEKARKNPEFSALAKDALWTLREVPAPRTIGSAEANLTYQPNWSYSAWPKLPWKVLKGIGKIKDNPDISTLVEGAYGYPQYEGNILDSTYLWKSNPFEVHFKSDSKRQSFSADYLLMYWMGRSSGLISEND